MIKQCWIYLLLLIVSGCGVTQQSSRQKAVQRLDTASTVAHVLESRTWEAEMTYVMPLRMRMRYLQDRYGLKLSGDTLYSNLPYYGRAYSIPYGGGKGLVFQAPIQDYQLNYSKKGFARLNIDVRNDEDRYTYQLDVFMNGHVDLVVRSQQRDPISFSGKLVHVNKTQK